MMNSYHRNENDKMRFYLFGEITFQVINPIALIESYCIQSDFYKRYDLIKNRTIEDVNKIGARINKRILLECRKIVESRQIKNLKIFKFNLDEFLGLTDEEIERCVKDFVYKPLIKLVKRKGIGLSKATKIYHTLYPEIIPIIDKALQHKYHDEIDPNFPINKEPSRKDFHKLFVEYYKNLSNEENNKNLNELHEILSENKVELTKIRIFDILWWSYLKSEAIRKKHDVEWTVIN